MSDAPRQIQAVLGRARPASSVAARDFRQPRRLGQGRLREIHLLVKNLLPALEKRLAEASGVRVALALASLGELDAESIFAEASEPLCVLRFRCGKAPSWLAWEPAAAVGVVETILGARGHEPAARRLSPTEVRVASQFLAEIVRAVAGALGIAVADFTLVQVASELGSWREGGEDAERHRLEVSLELRLGERTSTLSLLLPGIGGGEEARPQLPEELPAHLERVEVELSACLSGCDISLDQLLALEEGDVIPLDARLGDPTALCVEGLTLAEARLGSHRGRLAVRIERLNVQSAAA